jgi:small neutral amino acid transporter SnatA (MarC family)
MEPDRRHNVLASVAMGYVTIYSLIALTQTFNQAAREIGMSPWQLLKKTLWYMLLGAVFGTGLACTIITIQCHDFRWNPGIVLMVLAFVGWRWYNWSAVKKQTRQ